MQKDHSPSSYIVLRKFSAGGVDWAANSVFDATLVSPRLLRLLREQRKIAPSDALPKMANGWNWHSLNRSVTKAPKYKPKNKPLKRPPPPDDAIRYKHIGGDRYAVIKGRHRVGVFVGRDAAAKFADNLRSERAAARGAAL